MRNDGRTAWQNFPFKVVRWYIVAAVVACLVYTVLSRSPQRVHCAAPRCNAHLFKFAVPELIKAVSPFTMLSNERRMNVVELTTRILTEGVDGDVVEAGVWQVGG